MPLNLPPPILYLITEGATTPGTTPASEDFTRILTLIRAAVAARLSLVQIREKNLNARLLYELTLRAATLTQGSATRLLVNDRADIARAAGADGVHLTTQSLNARDLRRVFGPQLLIGVSTHSLAEARAARESGADFATFGPIFETPSKRIYGPPVGLLQLAEAAHALAPFPLLALGGLTRANASQALRAGAHGIAAISLFSDPYNLSEVADAIRHG
ncbi:MAG TPA: thiamine phosphate synthase [Pyrinomonadaceae bacterium]|jgi:thiamine-phosphate pyrophosphorylase|nr:thiamine phosphate synthase [Pyrinomonadaceae bacterium]